jgi:hypothetical protein
VGSSQRSWRTLAIAWEIFQLLLTQSNRSAGRKRQRKRPARNATAKVHLPSATCGTCGVRLTDASREVCDTCLPERRSAAGTIGRRGSKSAPTPPTSQTHSQARREAATGWEEISGFEPRDRRSFDKQIRARLRNIPVKLIARATGLSRSYCARIRNGPVTPHPRHWATLRGLLDPNQDRPVPD